MVGDGQLDQPGGQPGAPVLRRGRHPADRPGRPVVQDADGGHDLALGLEPQVLGRGLQVAPVQLRVRALLLHDEDVDPQPAQPVDLERGQVGEAGAAEDGLRQGRGGVGHGSFVPESSSSLCERYQSGTASHHQARTAATARETVQASVR